MLEKVLDIERFPGNEIKWIPEYEIVLYLYTAVSALVKFGFTTIGIARFSPHNLDLKPLKADIFSDSLYELVFYWKWFLVCVAFLYGVRAIEVSKIGKVIIFTRLKM